MKLSLPSIIPQGVGSPASTLSYRQKVRYNSPISHTQHGSNFSILPTAGNLLILIINCGSVINAVGPGVWTKDVTLVNAVETSIYRKTSDGTENVLNILGNSAAGCNFIAYEFPVYTAFDKSATTTISAAALTAGVGPTAATTAANEIAIAVLGFSDSPNLQTMAPILSWSNGFVQDDYIIAQDSTGGSNVELAIALKLLNATGTVTVNATWTANSANNTNMLLGTYK